MEQSNLTPELELTLYFANVMELGLLSVGYHSIITEQDLFQTLTDVFVV
jgi:hypothetical protein